MEMYNEINTVFMPANTTSILQPMYQRVISLSTYYLRNIYCKAIAATDSDSSDGSGQNKLKHFWKVFTFLDAIKNICNSWEEVKIPTFTGLWKKLIPALMDDFEKLEISVKEVALDVVEIERELELVVEPERCD